MSVKKNIVYNIINNISAIIFPIITIPYISRILGVENIGILGFSISYAGYFCLFANLGISIYGAREIAKLKENREGRNKLFSELFLLMIISSSICSVLYLISIFTVPSLKDIRSFLIISGISIYLSSFTLDWFFSGRENFKMITVRSVLVKLLALILMFLFVKKGEDTLLYCGITALSGVLNNVWNFQYLIRKEISISFSVRFLSLKIHLKPLITLLTTNLAISIYTMLDTLMLGFMSTYSEVGYYHSATRISRILLPFAVATTTVMIPRLSYASTKSDKTEYNYYLTRSFSIVSFFSVPMAIGLFIITPSLIPVFLGDEFLAVIPVLQVQSVILFFVGLSNFAGIQVLATAGFESKLLIAIACGAIVNLLLNLIIIPRYGAIGASITSAIAEFIIALITFYMMYTVARVKINWIPIFQALISSIPMLTIYLLLPENLNGIYALSTLVLCGVLSYFLCQYLIFQNQIVLELKNKIFKRIHKWI